MASTVTVTGSIGPNVTLTSKVFSNVTSFKVDPVLGLLEINQSNVITAIAIGAATTMTVTISGTDYTVTIS